MILINETFHILYIYIYMYIHSDMNVNIFTLNSSHYNIAFHSKTATLYRKYNTYKVAFKIKKKQNEEVAFKFTMCSHSFIESLYGTEPLTLVHSYLCFPFCLFTLTLYYTHFQTEGRVILRIRMVISKCWKKLKDVSEHAE